jgi:hypothetical protein
MSDLMVRLGAMDELFVAPADGVRASYPRLSSGVDEVLSELGARRLGTVGKVTIAVPADEIHPRSQDQVRDWVKKYCELRLRETDNELRAMRGDGLRALALGLTVLFVGLALSAFVLHSSAPHEIRTYFGEGLFVVIAWVGAWYPLDVLIHYPRPLRRTKKLLEALSRTEVVLVPADTR